MKDDPYVEIRALRERLARLEEIARRPPRGDLGDAVAAAMDTAQPPKPTRAERDMANLAVFYSPSPQAEAEHREREWLGAQEYDRRLREARGDPLAAAITEAAREAHVKLGRDLPTPEED